MRESTGINSGGMDLTTEAKALASMLRRIDRDERPDAHLSGCKAFVKGTGSGAALSKAKRIVDALSLNDDDLLYCLGRTKQMEPVDSAGAFPVALHWVDPRANHRQFEHAIREMYALTLRYLDVASSVDDLRQNIQEGLEFACVRANPRYTHRLRSFVRLRALSEEGVKSIDDGAAKSGFDLTPQRHRRRVVPPPSGRMLDTPGLYVTMVVDPDPGRSVLLACLGLLEEYEGRVFTKPSTTPGHRFCERRATQVNEAIWEIDRERVLPLIAQVNERRKNR